MKHSLLFFSLLLTLGGLRAQGIVYVDAAAAGGNDGSSWADAYTDLQAALADAEAGSSVWIAEGRYVTPAEGPFYINQTLSLYGGFAGGEESVDAADPMANVTILSGDVEGNDAMPYDSLMALDNNRVLVVENSEGAADFLVTIDGLTIRDGIIAANPKEDEDVMDFAGGGLYASGRVDVSRVTFTNNRAFFGSASMVGSAVSARSTFTDVTSTGNYHGLGGAHLFLQADSVTITGSSFSDPADAAASSGFITVIQTDGFFVDNSTFTGFTGDDTSQGGAINSSNSFNIRISGSEFMELSGYQGGALYARNANNFASGRDNAATEYIVDDCTFADISGTSYGGVIFMSNMSHTVTNSTFTDNVGAQTEGIGGAIYGQKLPDDQLTYTYRLDNNEFLRNTAAGSNGGAIFYFTDMTDVFITNSTFDGNNAAANGGAITLQGSEDDQDSGSVIENCEFSNSFAGGFGGAALLILFEDTDITNSTFTGSNARNGSVLLAGGGTTFNVRGSDFSNNGNGTVATINRGAGLWVELYGGNQPDALLVDSCTFNNNVITGDDFISGGAAIYMTGDTTTSPSVRIANSSFTNNAANDADGAILVLNGMDVEIVNSDFFANTSTGSGGAINVLQLPNPGDTIDNVPTFFYPEGNLPSLKIERSLFVNNTAGVQGGAINLTTGQLDMRNSIMIGNAVANGSGSGGGIIINGSSIPNGVLDNYLINNTFYNNIDGGREETTQNDTIIPGSAGNAIALFQPGGTDPAMNSLTLTIQNNAFFLDALAEESIGLELNRGDVNDPTGFGEINVVSNGGNFFSSELSGDLTFVTSEDVVDTEVDIEDVFYDPLESSLSTQYPDVNLIGTAETNPLVDGGTTGELVPEVDFYNRERDDMPDIGAIELDANYTSVAEPIAQSGLALKFFPNPTVDVVNIVNEDPDVRNFTVLVSDMQGRYVAGRQFAGTVNVLDVSGLPKGVYNLMLLINGKAYSQQVMKQ